MIKLVTFNLRYPAANDGKNYFPFRLPLILKAMRKEQPDVMGVQECKPEMHQALSAMLPEYASVGVCRGATLDDEGTHIFYRKDRFEACAFETFWLSPTPTVPGSRYPNQSMNPRVCTWAKLWDKKQLRFFYFVNTHLDDLSPSARQTGLSQILNKIKELKAQQDIPLFLTGDFNVVKEKEPDTYALLQAAGLNDLTLGMSGTSHGYMAYEPVKIDYILSDLPASCFSAPYQLHECVNGVYLSDHNPVIVEWNEEA